MFLLKPWIRLVVIAVERRMVFDERLAQHIDHRQRGVLGDGSVRFADIQCSLLGNLDVVGQRLSPRQGLRGAGDEVGTSAAFVRCRPFLKLHAGGARQ